MLTICTGNAGKFEQIAAVLQPEIIVSQRAIDLLEVQTNDMLAVSRMKAIEAYTIVQWPVLVDDSGIYFDAYQDFPWVFTKYIFWSLWTEWLQKLFIDQQNHKAYYQCVLSYMDETLQEPQQFVGTVPGIMDFSFLDRVHPDPHLPYDAIFRLENASTVVQMDMNSFVLDNHRARAARAVKEWLVER
jgi:XTP/dITP diphosphohydrolase